MSCSIFMAEIYLRRHFNLSQTRVSSHLDTGHHRSDLSDHQFIVYQCSSLQTLDVSKNPPICCQFLLHITISKTKHAGSYFRRSVKCPTKLSTLKTFDCCFQDIPFSPKWSCKLGSCGIQW